MNTVRGEDDHQGWFGQAVMEGIRSGRIVFKVDGKEVTVPDRDDVVVSARIPSQQVAMLDEIAQQLGVRRSEIVRQAIADWLQQRVGSGLQGMGQRLREAEKQVARYEQALGDIFERLLAERLPRPDNEQEEP